MKICCNLLQIENEVLFFDDFFTCDFTWPTIMGDQDLFFCSNWALHEQKSLLLMMNPWITSRTSEREFCLYSIQLKQKRPRPPLIIGHMWIIKKKTVKHLSLTYFLIYLQRILKFEESITKILDSIIKIFNLTTNLLNVRSSEGSRPKKQKIKGGAKKRSSPRHQLWQSSGGSHRFSDKKWSGSPSLTPRRIFQIWRHFFNWRTYRKLAKTSTLNWKKQQKSEKKCSTEF